MSRFGEIVAHTKEHVQEQTVDEVMARIQAKEVMAFIDVREDREWVTAHATDAIHVGKGVLERDIESAVPDLNTPIVLYCGGGARSVLAAASLNKMGYTHVVSMAGGFADWKSAGHPISAGDA